MNENERRMKNISEDELRDIADYTAKKFFAILGVDIDKPESVEDFREDLRFGKKLRRAADHGMLAFLGIVAAAVAAAIWSGIVSAVRGG